jgi:hypothetical protein
MDLLGWWEYLERWLQHHHLSDEVKLVLEVAAFTIILWRLRRARVRLQAVVREMELTLAKRISAV